MAYKLLIMPAAVRDLRKHVPRQFRESVDTAIQKLAENPTPPGSKMLHAGLRLFRVRVGDYRVLYSVTRDAVVIEKVGHRKEVYRFLER